MLKTLSILALTAALGATASAQCGLGGLEVKVSPAAAKVGEKITVSVKNTSATCSYNLPTLCVFRKIRENDCQGQPVVDLICGGALVTIGPGQTKSQTWDQIDDNGAQVLDGTYVFEIDVWDDNFASLLKICAPVDIGCVTPPQPYGTASVGTGGVEPIMSTSGGAPIAGNTNFKINVTGGLGGAPAAFFFGVQQGNIPVSWGTFLIDPNFPLFQFNISLGGTPGAAGAGAVTIPLPIPNVPGIGGQVAYFQTLIGDSGSTGGIAHTKGLAITFCQ